jgi:hypothetical protein
MAYFKVIWTCSGPQGFGWREQVQWAGNTIQDCIADAKRTALPRRNLLSTDCNLDSITVTGISPQLGSEPLYGDADCGQGKAAGGLNFDVQDCLWCRIYDQSGYFGRNHYLRGLPPDFLANMWRSGPKIQLNALVNPLLIDFFASLGMAGWANPLPPPGGGILVGRKPATVVKGKFGWLTRGLPGPPNGAAVVRYPRDQVTSVKGTVEGCWIIITAKTTQDYSEGDVIHLGGLRGCGYKGLSGDHKITDIVYNAPTPDQDTLTLDLKPCCNSFGAYNMKGYIYPVKTTFINFDNWMPMGSTDRKTGQAKYETKGRRPKGCCL